jgi:hypothetical protein
MAPKTIVKAPRTSTQAQFLASNSSIESTPFHLR